MGLALPKWISDPVTVTSITFCVFYYCEEGCLYTIYHYLTLYFYYI